MTRGRDFDVVIVDEAANWDAATLEVLTHRSTVWAMCSCGAQIRRGTADGEVTEDWDTPHAVGCPQAPS